MTTASDVIDAARARLVAAYPGASEVSANATAISPANCPAFALEIDQTDAAPNGMGGSGQQITADLTVSFWAVGGDDLEQTLLEFSKEAQLEIMGSPILLGGILFAFSPGSTETAIETGDKRVGRLDLTLIAKFIDQAEPGGGFSSGFSLGFRV